MASGRNGRGGDLHVSALEAWRNDQLAKNARITDFEVSFISLLVEVEEKRMKGDRKIKVERKWGGGGGAKHGGMASWLNMRESLIGIRENIVKEKWKGGKKL